MSTPVQASAQAAPEPDPPLIPPELQITTKPLGVSAATSLPPVVEWIFHKSADGSQPSGSEQRMLWLMNRARSNPSAEGAYLAGSMHPDIANGRNFYGVDLAALTDAFDVLEPRPPAAFDIRLHDASVLHSLDLIERNSQDHEGQFDRVYESGFTCNGGNASVFSYASSALNAHAALNIDWGIGPNGMQDPPGHRNAIMGVWMFPGPGQTNVGLALVEESDPSTGVGPLVFSGAYCQAGGTDHNRFLVGTVWEDLNANSEYDENEGLAGVQVVPDSGTYFAVTGDAGGYAIPIENIGSYLVEFSGGELSAPSVIMQVEVGTESVRLDLLAGTDTDGDGVLDDNDAFPYDATESTDTDGDGVGDNADTDDDNDGVLDVNDEYPVGRFGDAGAGYWAFHFIETLARAGITGGCGGNEYCPDDQVTRAQMAVFLERGMNGSEFSPPEATGNVFLDVGETDFAATFIEQLFADGITSGCGSGNYCPTESVTRAQMAVFLLRAIHGSGYAPSASMGTFSDVASGHWAASWIEQLAAEGITSGCGGGNFCPEQPVTRAQMAVFLVRAFDL